MGIRKKKIEIGPDTVLQRRNDLLFNEIDGEVVMLSVENGEYYGMNNVGSRIWELLKKPISYQKLITQLLEKYIVTEEDCDSELIKFINELIHKDLLLIK